MVLDLSSDNQLVAKNEPEQPNNFESVVVNDSSDVHIGDKKIYNDPVVINLQAGPGGIRRDAGSNGKLALKDVIVNTIAKGDEESGGKKVEGMEESRTDGTNDTNYGKWSIFNPHYRIYLISTLVTLLLLVILIVVILLVISSHSNDFGNLKLVARSEWGAQSPESPSTPLRHPVPYVIIHHTATENCTDIQKCSLQTKAIQQFHKESRGWWDIGYNFLVGGDGFAYEGRGWYGEGAHAYGYNSKSIGIAFIGTFTHYGAPKRQIDAAKRLIEVGVDGGFIAEDYKLLAVRQLQATQSPGKLLFEDVKTWPHWSETP